MAPRYLNDLFEGLYLTGEAKDQDFYPVSQIAKAGRRYLQAIGVEKFPSTYVDDNIEEYIEAHMNPHYQPAELAGTIDNTSLVLGIIVGTAYFHPDSRLSNDQKNFLLQQSIGALDRVQVIEPGHPRSDKMSFSWMFAECVRNYYPSADVREVEGRVLTQFEAKASTSQVRTKRRWGRKLLNALADDPRSTEIPPHLRRKFDD